MSRFSELDVCKNPEIPFKLENEGCIAKIRVGELDRKWCYGLEVSLKFANHSGTHYPCSKKNLTYNTRSEAVIAAADKMAEIIKKKKEDQEPQFWPKFKCFDEFLGFYISAKQRPSGFSEETKLRIRRRKRARRLWKENPIFAFRTMQAEYDNYTHETFLDDLKIKSKKKERRVKNPLLRFGRWRQMENQLSSYRKTGDVKFLEMAQKLRNNMTKPYRLLVRYEKDEVEYTFPATYKYDLIAKLSALAKQCKSQVEFKEKMEEITKYAHAG